MIDAIRPTTSPETVAMTERLAAAVTVLRDITQNIPASHGAPHAERVGQLCRRMAISEGYDPEVATFTGLFHDLRHFDEAERRARKLNIPASRTGKKDIRTVLEEFQQAHGWPDEVVKQEMLDAILNHGKLPVAGETAPPLLRILRDGDRLSRLGKEGLISILDANKGYGVPFYNDGEPVDWDPDVPLIANEDIKSCITDVRACLTWWQIMETNAGRALFREMHRINVQFLEAFAVNHEPRNYDYWIDWTNTQ